MTSFLVDIVLLVVMIATIGYLVVVSRRLHAIRSSQSDLAKVVEQFSVFVDEAEKAVETFRTEAEKARGEAEQRSRTLASQVAAADSLARRLDGMRQDLVSAAMKADICADNLKDLIKRTDFLAATYEQKLAATAEDAPGEFVPAATGSEVVSSEPARLRRPVGAHFLKGGE
jgi:hypothetical protein